jgi:hypothetical protein
MGSHVYLLVGLLGRRSGSLGVMHAFGRYDEFQNTKHQKYIVYRQENEEWQCERTGLDSDSMLSRGARKFATPMSLPVNLTMQNIPSWHILMYHDDPSRVPEEYDTRYRDTCILVSNDVICQAQGLSTLRSTKTRSASLEE